MRITTLLRLLLFAMLLPNIVFAQETQKAVPALGWDFEKQGGFPLCIAQDTQNAIWVGTENKGLWRYDAGEKKWTQFTTKDGLGDDSIYAVAVDKLGRVWAGHLNHGVSVWNGEKWRNYGLLEGPLGDHVFAIAICPTDGDVWIATDLGLARYLVAKEEWDYYTRVSGLPSDQIQSIAFDLNGDIYVGTQCDGIALADAAENYKKWRTVSGPRQMPNARLGEGLPSNVINSVSVIRPVIHGGPMPVGDLQLLAVATPWGVGGAPLSGTEQIPEVQGKWGFIRGDDWQANLEGRFNPPPPSGPEPALPPGAPTLMEDWVTCVQQEEGGGKLWFGYRQKGAEIREFESGKSELQLSVESGQSVRAIFARANALPLFAVCNDKNGGLKTLEKAEPSATSAEAEPPQQNAAAEPQKAPALPAPAKAPTAETFPPLITRLDQLKNRFGAGHGAFLGDDWRTGGDWVGRYGGSFAKLCGMQMNMAYENESGYEVQLRVGPHTKGDDNNVYTYTGTAKSDNPGALYHPELGHRREAEENDGSFARDEYPFEWEGPDLWVDLKVPEGAHCVSLYFHNYDALRGNWNKFRDYDVQLLPWDEEAEKVQNAEPIARCRVRDFWSGVYKQFLVCGPSRFVIRVGRNHSFVTKLQGVFIDRLEPGGEERKPLPGFESVSYAPPAADDENESELAATARGVWSKLDESLGKPGAVPLQLPFRIWAYRAAVAGNASAERLAQWRWQIGLWTPEDRKEFQEVTARAFKEYAAQHPEAAEKEKAEPAPEAEEMQNDGMPNAE